MKTRVDGLRTQLQTNMRARTLDPRHVDITCPALVSTLAAADNLTGGERFLDVVRSAPAVIERECACNGVDVEGLAAWLWLRHEPWQPVVRGHAWTLGDPSAEVVEFAPTATVADLLPAIDAHAGRRCSTAASGASRCGAPRGSPCSPPAPRSRPSAC